MGDFLKLSEVCQKGNSNIAMKDLENRSGEYEIYGASGLIKKVDFYQQERPYIAIVKDGAGVGRVMKLPAKSSVIGTMQYIIPNEGIDVNFLAYALEHLNLSRYNTGATIPHIYFKDYCVETIPAYPLSEQKQIARVLDKISSMISLRRKQLSKLDGLVKSRFIELFGDSTHSTNKVLLEDISAFVTVGIANSATHAYVDNGIVMLRNQNIKENHLDENDLIYITPDFAKKYGSKQLAENDILVIRTGYPGVACLVPKKYEGCQTFTTLIVRLKDSTSAHANYVCHYINSSFGKDYVEQSKVGVAQQNFGAKALAKMPIVVPPMELQEEFAAFVEQTDKSKFEIQKSLEKLETLKKALMQKYFG